MEDQGTDGSYPEGLSPQQQRTILDTAVNPFVLMGTDGVVTWAGASIEELLGYPPEALVGRQMLDLIAPESQADAVRALAGAVADRNPQTLTTGWEGVGPVYSVLRADGSTVSCAVAVATPVRTGFDHFVLQLRRSDATAALGRLHLSMGTGEPLGAVLKLVAAVLEGELPSADVVLFHFDRELKRLVSSATGPSLADDHDLPALLGQTWSEAEGTPGEVLNLAVDDLPPEVRTLAADAGYHWLVLTSIEPLTGDEDRGGMVTAWSRTDHRMHALNHERVLRCGSLMGVALKNDWGRQALEWAATHDILTGLHNRAVFIDELAALQNGHRKTDAGAVLYLDLDDFKPVNERFGHPLGDQVLVKIADRLRHLIRPTDMVARLGGDEFAVLCAGLDDQETLEKLAERLVTEIQEPIEVDGQLVVVGLSIGIATAGSGGDVDAVMERADDALRLAKAGGKARWRVAD